MAFISRGASGVSPSRAVSATRASSRCGGLGGRLRTEMCAALLVFFLASFINVVAPSDLVAQASSGGSGKLSIPEKIMEGRCITRVSPRYPMNTPPGSQEVLLRAIIDRHGQVHPLYLVSGSREFEIEAMSAVRMWQYRPFMRDDQAIDTETNIRVRFTPGLPSGLVTHPSR